MSYIIYPLGKAKAAYKKQVAANYDEQRQSIYEQLKKKNIQAESFLNEENFNILSKKNNEIFKKLIKELNSVAPKAEERGYVFNGIDDRETIQKIIGLAKQLKNVETFEEVTKIINKLDNANDFIKEELKGRMNNEQLLSIATKDFAYLKEAINIAKNSNNIEKVREKAKNYFSGLIGNLGESLGVLYGYSLVSKDVQKDLSSLGITMKVSNAGGDVVDGKRAVGDTKIEFIYKGNQVLGSISMSNKLSADYGKTKSHNIKLRSTTVNQLRDDLKPAYYNLISFHGAGRKPENLRLDLATNAETLSFRRYIAAIILEENLFGSFQGDNVYYFNYGEYIITMNDLLDY